MRHYTENLNNLPIDVTCNLFDALIKPILSYNAEITYLDSYISYFRAKNRASISGKEVNQLNFIDKNPLENLHLSFCKNLLGVNRCASNIASRLELKRLPIESHIKVQTIAYFARFSSNELNPLLKEAFELSKELDLGGIYTWYSYAKDIIKENKINIHNIYNK